MKTFSRVILALILIVSLLFAFSILASAAEPTDDAPETENAVEAENGASETVSEKKSFGAVIWDFVADNADKIFAAATVIGTTVLAIMYKRGFLPTLSTSLKKFNKATSETMTVLGVQNSEIAVNIATIAATITPFLTRAEELLAELEKQKTYKDAQVVIDKGVFDLLGLIIESGRVPDSVKEQFRLEKVKADKAMMEIEAGDSE